MKIINIGKITGTHGIKGFVKIKTPNGYDLFAGLKYLVVGCNGKITGSFRIEEIKTNKDIVLVKCEGFDSIDDALKLKGLYVISTTEEIIEDPNECSPEELLGAKVLDVSGEEFGTLEDILDNGFNEIFRIKSIEGRFFLIANNDNHVPTIDILNKTIHINKDGLVSEDI